MTIASGTRLGSYDVLALIGRGGMGQVYRARDTKLDRDVALKVLPDAFAADPERIARFQREAKTLASLNHPNIAAIYGLEETDGVQALVLELVEGPTLADRIARGAVPVGEALPMARQIADALEAAHEQGVIHRDLKPANVKVRSDGTVKILDFGLAKAFAPDVGGGAADLANSPTLSMQATICGPATCQGASSAGRIQMMRRKLGPVPCRTAAWPSHVCRPSPLAISTYPRPTERAFRKRGPVLAGRTLPHLR